MELERSNSQRERELGIFAERELAIRTDCPASRSRGAHYDATAGALSTASQPLEASRCALDATCCASLSALHAAPSLPQPPLENPVDGPFRRKG